jgi:hypothetical protein
MYTKWTQHLKDPEEKQRFVNEILSSKHVLEHLMALLDEEEKVLNRSEIEPTAYNVPSWPYFQAHKNGFRQCLYKIKKIIDLDQQKE